MNALKSMLWGTAAATAMSCVGDPCALSAEGHLDAARDLSTQVRVFREPVGAACLDLRRADVQVTFPADMAGTFPQLSFGEDDLRVELICGGPDGVARELSVSVGEHGQIQWQGKARFSCHGVAGASPRPVSSRRALGGYGYVLGGVVGFALDLKDRAGNPLTGFGATPADSMLGGGVLNFEHQVEMFHAVTPGSSPAVSIAGLTRTVPVTIVQDGTWDLKVDVRPSELPGVFLFSAWPVTPANARLDGMEECRWTAVTSTSSTVLAENACDVFHGSNVSATGEAVTQLCVTTLGRSACADMPQ